MAYGTYVNTASMRWIFASLIRNASSKVMELGHFSQVFISVPLVSRKRSHSFA